MITEPGIYRNVSPTDYFGRLTPERALSASGIKTLLTATPAEFIAPPKKSNAALRKGDVAHQLALGKGRGFAVGDFPTWASKDAKAFKETAELSGLTPIKVAEYEEAVIQADVMRAKIERVLTKLGNGFLPAYETEVVMIWIEHTAQGPIFCKLMADVWCEELGVILDPKFSARLADGVFEAHATAMGWDMQGAWYIRGAEAVFPDMQGRIRFINLVVAPDAPNVSRAREADEATRYSCEMEIGRAKAIFGRCVYANDWPEYPDEIEPWTAKSWTLSERAMRSAEEDSE